MIHYLKTGEHLPNPSLQELFETLSRHYEDMLDHYGPEVGNRVSRKHVSWYTKGLPESTVFRDQVNRSLDTDTVRRLFTEYFERLLEREAA